MKKHRLIVITLLIVLLLSVLTPALAQKNDAGVGKNLSITALHRPVPIDLAEKEVFMDNLLKQEMGEYHIT